MTLSFNHDFDRRHGEAVEVAPNIRRVTCRNPGPFTFQGTNTFLIGGRELAVLDPGPEDAAHLAALLAAIGDASVRHILVSHSHADHAPGARLLQAAIDAPILAASRRTAAPAAAIPAKLDAVPDSAFSPDTLLTDGTIIQGDGYRLEAVATPGHASDHMALALSGSDILFSGDHVMGWSTTVVAPPDGSMRDYMASLDRLLARPESLYLPAHGGAIPNAREYVRALKTHRLIRERAILERLASGDRTVREIVVRIYGDIDPGLHPAAALSTLAHLEDLVGRGLVLADGVPSLAATYWPGGASTSGGGASSAAGAGPAGAATAGVPKAAAS